jgi:hypothetical protein
MCGKGSNTTTTNQTQTYTPAGGSQIQGALTQAQNAAQLPFNIPQAPVAGFSQDQQSAFGNINAAQGMAQPYINQAQQYFSPQGAQAFANPYIDAVTAQMKDLFGAQNSQNNSNLVQAAGGIGADRIAVGQGTLANQQALAAGQTYSGIYNNAAQQAQAAGYGTAALGSQAQNAALSGAQAQLASGGLQQQLQQAQLNSPYQQQLAQAAFPYQQAQFLAGITGALAPGLGGTTTGQGTTTAPAPSIWSQILGLGTAGLGAAGGLGAFSGGSGYQNSTGNYMGISDSSQDALQDAGFPLPNARGGRIYARGGGTGYDEGGEVEGNPYQLPPGFNDRPINVAEHSIVPQVQQAAIKPNIPQLNLNPPQQSKSGSSGPGIADIAKLAMMFVKDGGRIPGAPYAYAEGGSTFDERFMGGDTDVINPDEPFRMPDKAAVDAWRDDASSPLAFSGPDSTMAFPPPPRALGRSVSAPAPTSAQEVSVPSQGATAAPEGSSKSDRFIDSPWAALMSAGLGIAGGTSPFPLVNIGQGGLQGVKMLEAQRAAGQKDETIAQASRRLDLEAKHHEDQYNRLTMGQKQQAELAHLPYEQLTAGQKAADKRAQQQFEEQRRQSDRPYSEMTAAQKAADERARAAADQDEWVPAGTIETEDGKSHPAVMEKSTGTIMDAVTGKPPGEGASILPKGAKKPISDQDARDVAERYIDTGNRMVLSGLGYSGDNRTKVNQQIKKVQDEKGVSNQELATREAEWEGRKAGQRVLAQQEAKMGSAAFEAEGAVKLARGVIEKVPRTNFLPLNKLIEGYQKNTLDPDQVELLGRLRAISNTYAAVMNRGASVVTDTARHHADDLLNSAGNATTMNRALDTMLSEIDMAKHSPDRMRRFYRQQYGDKSIGQDSAAAPPEGGPAPAGAPAGGAKTVIQNGHTYTLNPSTGQYE